MTGSKQPDLVGNARDTRVPRTQTIQAKPPISAKRMLRALIILAIGAGILAILYFGGRSLIEFVEMAFMLQKLAADQMLNHPAVFAMLAIYILLLAIPFVPGTELGLMLLMVFGGSIAGHVYVATLCGLLLAFGIGRLVPKENLLAVLQRAGLTRAATLLATDQKVSPDVGQAPPNQWWQRLLRRVMQHRCYALAVLLNMPGNTVLGGGGGIAMMTGVSRLMTPRAFAITVALAVAPVPISFAVGTFFGT